MKEIARTLAIESYLSERTGLLPPLLANKLHNPGVSGWFLGRGLSWATYYNWARLNMLAEGPSSKRQLRKLLRSKISTKLLSLDEGLNESEAAVVVRFFHDPNVFGDWIERKDQLCPSDLQEPAFSNSYPEMVKTHAERIVNEIGRPVGVVHIRRGDLAGSETDPPQVIRYLQGKGAKPQDLIVGLTNETDGQFFHAVRESFPGMIFESEIRYLKDKAIRRDNYLVFRIGRCLQAEYDKLDLGSMRFMRRVRKATPSRGFSKLVNYLQNGLMRQFQLTEEKLRSWCNKDR